MIGAESAQFRRYKVVDILGADLTKIVHLMQELLTGRVRLVGKS